MSTSFSLTLKIISSLSDENLFKLLYYKYLGYKSLLHVHLVHTKATRTRRVGMSFIVYYCPAGDNQSPIQSSELITDTGVD